MGFMGVYRAYRVYRVYRVFRAHGVYGAFRVYRVLVRGFNLSYHNKETALFTTHPCYGNLN